MRPTTQTRDPALLLAAALAALLLGAFGLACDESEPTASNEASRDDFEEPTGDGGSPGGGGTVVDIPPLRLTEPAASPNFVFIANASRGSVAKVALDGSAIRIATVRVGASPSVVIASPVEDVAVVLNAGSDSVSIIEAGPIGGEDTVRTYDIPRGCNRLALGPNGAYVFAWFDADVAVAGDELGPLSEISVVPVGADVIDAYQVSVGVGIRSVAFSEDGADAYVVSDEGVSVLRLADLEGDRFVPPVPLADASEPVALITDRDVEVVREGDFAVVRFGTEPLARIVDLASAERFDVELPRDLSALRVVPDQRIAVLSFFEGTEVGLVNLDVAVAGGDALTLLDTGVTAAQVAIAPSSDRAIAYASPLEEVRLAVIDIAAESVEVVNVRKSVAAVSFDPSGRFAVVQHTRAPGDPVAGEPEEDIIAKSNAISALDLDTGNTKLVRLDATASEIAFDASTEAAFVLVANEASGVNDIVWLELRTLRTQVISFERLPEHVGVVPASGAAFVSQQHPLGRIAFIDLADGEIREVTGFELNGFID